MAKAVKNGTGAFVTTTEALNRIKRAILSERELLAIIIVYGVATSVCTLAIPIAVQSLVGSVTFSAAAQPIVVLSLVLLGVLALSAVLRLLQITASELLQQRIFARTTLSIATNLPNVRLKAYDAYRGTDIVNRFFDVFTVQKSTSLLLTEGLGITLHTAVGLTLLAFYHPFLLAFDILLLSLVCIAVILPLREGVTSSDKESKAKYEVAGWLEELARFPYAFRSKASARFALTRADTKIFEYLQARRKHFRVLLLQNGALLGVQVVASALLLGLGGWLVIKDQLSLGQLVAAEIVVTFMVSSLTKAGKLMETFYDLTAALGKLQSLIDLEQEPVKTAEVAAELEARPLSVSFQNVSFGYKSQIFSDSDFHVASNEVVGIHGPIGSGKSSVLELIMGLREPGAGSVLVNEFDLRDISLESLRKNTGYVRGNQVIAASVLENVRMGRSDIDMAAVHSSLKKVGLLEDVQKLDHGLNTEFTASLIPLSSGKIMQLMIARAIAGAPKLLLIDETLDALDRHHLDIIREEILAPARREWTVIITTNSSRILSLCDRTYRIQDGRLEEFRS